MFFYFFNYFILNKKLDKIAISTYRKVPFHNFEHALNVRKAFSEISNSLGINSKVLDVLWVAAIFHDSWHLYELKSTDEEKACQLTSKILEKLEYSNTDIDKIINLIMWTVFLERGNISDFDQMIIADSDISSIWKDYNVFLKSTARLYIETLKQEDYPSESWIIIFFKNTLNWFFWLLTSITWKKDNPFLLSNTSKIFPNFVENRDKLSNDINNNHNHLINIVKHEWKYFYWNELILFEEFNL